MFRKHFERSADNMKKQGLMDMFMVLVLTTVFFPFSIEASKCSGSCNNINYPYAKICVPGVVKNLNVKKFNLMSRINERRYIEWHETFKCKCKFGENVCNVRQRCNKNK